MASLQFLRSGVVGRERVVLAVHEMGLHRLGCAVRPARLEDTMAGVLVLLHHRHLPGPCYLQRMSDVPDRPSYESLVLRHDQGRL